MRWAVKFGLPTALGSGVAVGDRGRQNRSLGVCCPRMHSGWYILDYNTETWGRGGGGGIRHPQQSKSKRNKTDGLGQFQQHAEKVYKQQNAIVLASSTDRHSSILGGAAQHSIAQSQQVAATFA